MTETFLFVKLGEEVVC